MSDSHTFQLDVKGIDELMQTLKNLATQYPDRAGELLKENAKDLRKDVIIETKTLTKTKASSKRSLAKASSYKITNVQGFGANQFVEISAKSPHFHLVEHGHDLYDHEGNKIGWVEGKHQFATAVAKFELKMPETVSNMVDKLLKEEGLK